MSRLQGLQTVEPIIEEETDAGTGTPADRWEGLAQTAVIYIEGTVNLHIADEFRGKEIILRFSAEDWLTLVGGAERMTEWSAENVTTRSSRPAEYQNPLAYSKEQIRARQSSRAEQAEGSGVNQ